MFCYFLFCTNVHIHCLYFLFFHLVTNSIIGLLGATSFVQLHSTLLNGCTVAHSAILVHIAMRLPLIFYSIMLHFYFYIAGGVS
jgi:hypothetical protein